MRRLLSKLMKPDPRECEEVRALMSDHVDGELEPALQRRVGDHVRFCPRCRRVLSNLQHTLGGLSRLRDALPATADSDEVAERVRSAWRERVDSDRRVGG